MNILFIDSAHPLLKDTLTSAGFECDYMPGISQSEISEIIHKYEGVITRSKIIFDKNLLDKAVRLRFIGRMGAGMEKINLEYASQKGIQCFNSPEGNRDAVGEHTLGMLLALMNNICRADREVRNGLWNRESNCGVEIKGKTVGIIGYGNMGGAFARKLKGFEASVIAYDKYKFRYSDDFVTESTLDDLFRRSDILSLHVPLTEETTYMADDTFINKFKKNICLINTSRGKVVNTADLVKNMKSGKITGAVLDVLEYEKTSFENIESKEMPDALRYLFASDRVILTPHIAGYTVESNRKHAEILSDKIINFLMPKG
ncbi:MAG: hydroxyacid dehydrogenase [Bacteroidia bacterium]|nr:hydroxyacid dehydrogenase [Bacteroidia bacterium]